MQDSRPGCPRQAGYLPYKIWILCNTHSFMGLLLPPPWQACYRMGLWFWTILSEVLAVTILEPTLSVTAQFQFVIGLAADAGEPLEALVIHP